MRHDEPPQDDAESRAHQTWLRHNLMALGWSMSFAGGALFGLLASALGLPGPLWASLLLAVSAGFFLFIRRGST